MDSSCFINEALLYRSELKTDSAAPSKITLSGIPSRVIVLRILLASRTLTRCRLKVRLRILMIVLYRQTVFSTRLRVL